MLCAGVWCWWWCGTRPGTLLGRGIHKVGGLWVPESKPSVFILSWQRREKGEGEDREKERERERWGGGQTEIVSKRPIASYHKDL